MIRKTVAAAIPANPHTDTHSHIPVKSTAIGTSRRVHQRECPQEPHHSWAHTHCFGKVARNSRGLLFSNRLIKQILFLEGVSRRSCGWWDCWVRTFERKTRMPSKKGFKEFWNKCFASGSSVKQVRFGWSCKQVEWNDKYSFAFNAFLVHCSAKLS